MSLRRLALPLIPLLAACGHAPIHPPTPPTVIVTSGPQKPITSEEEYNSARPEFDALSLAAPDRDPRRAALEAWLLGEVRDSLDRNHPEDAYEQFRQAVTLWDPAELAKRPSDPALRKVADRVETAFRKRGAHEEVVLALAVELALASDGGGHDDGAHHRYDQIVGWLRAGGATESELGGAVDGRGRVIDDLESVARVWPSPFVVEQLTNLYFERNEVGLADALGDLKHPRRAADLRALLQGGGMPSSAYDLTRLYLRVSRPDDALAQLRKLKTLRPGDEQVKKLIEKYAGKEATPGDAINVAMLMAQGHDDADVAERVCADASRRFLQAPEPRLCAGQIAMVRDRLVVAMMEFEAARQLQPGNREIWQHLAQLWERRLFQLAADENLDVTKLEPQLKRVEAFHQAAAKQFPGEPLHPTLAGALFEVGRGYYNVGRVQKAMEYFDRSLGIEPQATTLELMGQIRLKKGEAKEAVALFERGIATPKGDRAEEIYWRSRLRRNLGDAHDLLGDAKAASDARKAALADWDQLAGLGLTNEGKAEAGVERAKLYYQLGDRDQSIALFEGAIDAAPDRSGTYADVIAFLVPRGELDESLDAYHRALGRNEVSEYLKVYCSLWIVDLARRAGQPIDPLASSYLQSMNGGKWYDDLARWATGRATDEQLMARVNTPAKRAESAFYRAMRAVGAGQLDEAKKLWKEVVDTDMMAFFEYDMSEMFLRAGTAPSKPLLKSKGTLKAPVAPRPPDGSI
jgi:tetratricopeptide (TPR) repeat protein